MLPASSGAMNAGPPISYVSALKSLQICHLHCCGLTIRKTAHDQGCLEPQLVFGCPFDKASLALSEEPRAVSICLASSPLSALARLSTQQTCQRLDDAMCDGELLPLLMANNLVLEAL
jgi:hypothetical protein